MRTPATGQSIAVMEMEVQALRKFARDVRRYIQHDAGCSKVEMAAKGFANWPACSCGAAEVLELAGRVP